MFQISLIRKYAQILNYESLINFVTMGHQILIQVSNTNVLLWPGAYTEKKTENLMWYDQDYVHQHQQREKSPSMEIKRISHSTLKS